MIWNTYLLWFEDVKDLDKPQSTEASKNKITANVDKDKVQ